MLALSTAYGCSQWEHRSAGRVTRYEVCIAKRSTSKNGRYCLFFDYNNCFFASSPLFKNLCCNIVLIEIYKLDIFKQLLFSFGSLTAIFIFKV